MEPRWDSLQKACKQFMDCIENQWYKVGDWPATWLWTLKMGCPETLHIIRIADFDFCLDLFREPGCRR